MFNKNKKLIEKIVDIKNHLNNILVTLLIVVLPLNQQYHFRPFSSVDGFIIDYLIVKVSITEIIAVLLFFINLNSIFKLIKFKVNNPGILVLLFFVVTSIIKSKYLTLALYENFILLIYVSLTYFFYKNLNLINKNYLTFSLKFWIVALSLLGFAQFYTQSSIFNNYAVFGEFPYSEDYYHIKQKNLFLGDFIPPYSIFSHTNIFGAYLIFSIFLLFLISKVNPFFYILVLIDLIIIGSVACLLGYFIFFLAIRLNTFYLKKLLVGIFLGALGVYFYFSYSALDYKNDFSIYRRLYMFDLSVNYFIENPLTLIEGGGYYNYFYLIKSQLYNYELVRFFQPPHFLPILIIWQYGILFLLTIIYFIYLNFELLNSKILRFLILFLILSCFDHYLLTNHQIKVLILFIIPYSLINKNSI